LTPHLIEFAFEVERRSAIADVSYDQKDSETRPEENSVNREERAGVEEGSR